MFDTNLAPLQVVDTRPEIRVSAIIVNYNGKRYLDGCLGSLLAEGRDDREIIVVDNASSDGSAAYIADRYPQIRLIRSEVNAGFAGGNNLAASQAAGEYLAFLNPDTVVEPGWLDELLAVLESDASIGLVTPQIRMLQDPRQLNTCGNEIHLSGLTLCRGMGCAPQAFSEAAEVGAVSGAAFVVRRELFERLGGFDEHFFMYMEDTDLSWRARLAGFRCVYVPTSVVYHDYRLKFGPNKTFYQERNRYLMLLKVYRWPTLLALLPAYLLAEMVTWGFVLGRERRNRTNKLRVYAWVVRHWREIRASRRRTQGLRRVRDQELLRRCTHELAFEQTGGGIVARGAHLLFDPLFETVHRLALAIVRW